MSTDHTWRFFRAGGVDQVVLQSGADLENLASLDQKLWVALACPTKGNAVDERSLAIVDTDKDGRIRPPEILETVAWCSKVVTSLDSFFEPGDSVPLALFDKKTPEGKAVAFRPSAVGRAPVPPELKVIISKSLITGLLPRA